MSAVTDKELLEKAAKAAGVKYDQSASMPRCGAWCGLWLVFDDEPSEHARRYWNPITDDGDALRLAVQLHISTYRAPSGMVMAISHDGKANFKEDSPADPLAATRRAIVRAAAALADGSE